MNFRKSTKIYSLDFNSDQVIDQENCSVLKGGMKRRRRSRNNRNNNHDDGNNYVFACCTRN